MLSAAFIDGIDVNGFDIMTWRYDELRCLAQASMSYARWRGNGLVGESTGFSNHLFTGEARIERISR